ncbi:MAG: hypothetical protein QXY37_04335, partial [Metallosphaera sp.]
GLGRFAPGFSVIWMRSIQITRNPNHGIVDDSVSPVKGSVGLGASTMYIFVYLAHRDVKGRLRSHNSDMEQVSMGLGASRPGSRLFGCEASK